ncbi:D-galacturonate reductase [Diplonema papillatum]|nr:D-galacturonate reductase [Diplonema papillatum]
MRLNIRLLLKAGLAVLIALQLWTAGSYLSSREARRTQSCTDSRPDCSVWAARGECLTNPGFMQEACRKSCNTCNAASTEPHPSPSSRDLGRMKTVRLPGEHGYEMPIIGFGTAGLGGNTKQAVLSALEIGYRHIDTAEAVEWYREDQVGQALKEYLNRKIQRSELFVTTKLHPKNLGEKATTASIRASIDNLGLDYIDLYLVHYPRCFGNLCSHQPEGTFRDSWKAMEAAVAQGLIRSIGVSNFGVAELKQLLSFARIPPAVLQAHSDPLDQNNAVQLYCRSKHIQFVAYSSLGTQQVMRARGGQNPVLSDPFLKKLEEKYDVSSAVVVLRWALQTGQVVIPRSRNPAHMAQNLRTVEAIPALTEAEMRQINALSR